MRLQPCQGMTLIELVMVILILSIIIGMSSSLLTQGLNTFSAGENVVNANWQGQIAMERMARDLLEVRSSANISTASAGTFSFIDVNDNTISYSLSGTSLNLTLNGNTAILADGVQSLAFAYFNKSGATTAATSLIRLVQVSINITQNNVNYSLTTSIYPRNLQ